MKMASRESNFSDWEGNHHNYPSTWKNTREYATKVSQTDEILFKDTGVQPESSHDQAIQADLGEKEIKVTSIEPPYPPSLYAFFTKVTDEVCRCLQENVDPFSVEVFKDTEDVEDISRNSEAVKEFTLQSASVSSEEFEATCITWNSKGTQIAMGYMAHTHTGWCSHRTPIACWNLRKIQNAVETSPHFEIFLPSCTTCMEFHPLHPSILVVGTYAGGVAVVDISVKVSRNQEESDSESRKPNQKRKQGGGGDNQQMDQLGYFMTKPEHAMLITAVHWMKLTASQSSQLIIKNKNASAFCIVSSGKDGCFCLWSTNTSNTRIVLEKKFIVWADSIPPDVPLGITSRITLKQLGIIRLGTCKDDPYACVLVTHGGHVFQANLDNNIEAYTAMMEMESSDISKQETFLDPGLVYVGSYGKSPQTLQCSPFHRDVFLVANTDGKVVIQNMLQPGSMYEYDLGDDRVLNDIKWSAHRPGLFAAAIERKMKVIDIRKSKEPVLSIRHEHPVSSIAFNGNEIGTLATCDRKGTLYIWNLPKRLCSTDPQELDILISKAPEIQSRARKDSGDV